MRIKSKVMIESMDITNNFIRTINKNLEHVLSNKYSASSQGRIINLDKTGLVIESADKYKQAASLTSLYSKITKSIICENISDDKIAFIFVTSSTANKSTEENITRLLIGEVIKFSCDKGKLTCESSETFQDTYDNNTIYTNPIILKDITLKLSEEGYNKILFISDAPYSSQLHMVSKDSENLYFMNESIVKMMNNISAKTKIYPVLFQQYHIYDSIEKGSSESLFMAPRFEKEYIECWENNFKASFFSLYNGITVGFNKNYKAVGMYSILINKYEDKSLNNSIRDLLNENSKIRNNIIECIKLFHLARFEAAKGSLLVKLNPYNRLNDDKSVSKKSVDDYKIGRVRLRFNSLAFLNEVKKTIDKDSLENK